MEVWDDGQRSSEETGKRGGEEESERINRHGGGLHGHCDMQEETREEQGSRRERVTICGTRGSFITEAESHGIGTHPISRKMRKMQIVEEEDDGLLSPHEGQQMDSFSSNADEGSSSRREQDPPSKKSVGECGVGKGGDEGGAVKESTGARLFSCCLA